ncbi:MAG TPA: N-acetyl-gamma-glutamyl-phosphate reductase, partial [Solirubrobacteraceae bacterium]|nr:N-acetyl-gamma-glutamyl-phosphate reductase [Solirubrobacteraceae bacterium]
MIVAGASGYTGALAAALLDRHPRFDLVGVTSRSDVGTPLSDLYPRHRVPLTLDEFDAERHGQADAAIVAYPHGAAAPVVAALNARGVRVVDLSADFRLRLVDVYEQWYVPHPHPELIGEAVYGLPELRR